MNELDLIEAIKHIKPNAEFSFIGTDYSTIKWDVLDGEAPTWQEIQTAYIAVQEAKAQVEAETQAKRAAALAKLAAVGLDEDDLKALGL
jgi:hypothetical protein